MKVLALPGLRRGSVVGALALVLLAALLLLPTLAAAGEVDDAALNADRVNQDACLAVGEGREVNEAGVAMAEVSAVWVEVDRVLEAAPEPKPSFLQYWRGVLGQCLDQDELALKDLQAFVEQESGNAVYADLVRDGKQRITRLERSLAGIVDRPTPPLLVISLGGGYQRMEAPSLTGWNYGVASVDVSVRLIGPLALTGFLRLGVSDLNLDSEGEPVAYDDGQPGRSVLPVFGLGPLLRFAGPVYGFVGLLAQFSPDDHQQLNTPFLAGATLTGGVEIPFGDAPLGVKAWGEVGFLHASITLRGMGGLFVRLGE